MTVAPDISKQQQQQKMHLYVKIGKKSVSPGNQNEKTVEKT